MSDVEMRDEVDPETLERIRKSGLDPSVVQGFREWLESGEDLTARNQISGSLRSPQAGEYLDRSHFKDDDALVADGQDAQAGTVALLVLNGGMATRFGGVVKGGVEVAPDHSFIALKLGMR